MANEQHGCDCAFCLNLSSSSLDWLIDGDAKGLPIYLNSSKILKNEATTTCKSRDKGVVSKTAVRNHVSPIKHKKTACEVALLAI